MKLIGIMPTLLWLVAFLALVWLLCRSVLLLRRKRLSALQKEAETILGQISAAAAGTGLAAAASEFSARPVSLLAYDPDLFNRFAELAGKTATPDRNMVDLQLFKSLGTVLAAYRQEAREYNGLIKDRPMRDVAKLSGFKPVPFNTGAGAALAR